jgi:hypothetical protein
MAAAGGDGLLPIPCGAGQHPTAEPVPGSSVPVVAACTAPPESDGEGLVGRGGRIVDRWIPAPRLLHPYPDARFDARIRARAVCGSSARTDLRGGRPAMAVPTATLFPNPWSSTSLP